MKSKLFFFVVFVTCFSNKARCQVEGVEFGITYNSVDMSDMRYLLNDAIAQDSTLSSSQDFENYFGYYLHMDLVGIQKKNTATSFGLIFDYTSSGGRVSIADYSGQFNQDLLTKVFSLGPTLRTYYFPSKFYNFGLDISATVSFSNLKILTNLNVNNNILVDEKLEFTSISGQLRLGILQRINISKTINITNRIGYLTELFPSRLKFKENEDLYLTGKFDNKLHLDWSGFRLGLGIGIRVM